MAALPDSGTLDALPLPRLLLALRRERFSGALVLCRERTEKRILLRDGVPVFAESNVASETLGVQLMDAGQLSREDHARVTRRVAERGCKEGAALLELELLAPRELFLALKEQVRRRIVDCFGWARGEWRLEAGEDLPEDLQPLRIDPIRLVHDGLERHWPPDRILAWLGPRMRTYPVPGSGFARLRERLAGEGADAVLDAFDGSTSLGDALERATSPRALAAVWLVDAAGAVEYREAPAGGDKPEAEAPADVEIVFGDEDAGADARGSSRAGRGAPDAAAAGPAADPGVEALRREVRERHARLGELDHYGVLGVTRDADPAAVKRAYFQAAKRFHPDALASLGLDDVRAEAMALFARIAKAYATLSDPRRRRDYDAELEGHTTADADRLANAEALFRKGEVLLRAGDFAGALQFLRPAVQMWPEDGAYRSALGWALFKRTPPQEEEAREHLEKALALDDRDATAHFRLSVVLRALGRERDADRHRDRAREIDPKVSAR